MDKKKLLPPFTMLSGGAVAILLLALGRYELKTLLGILLIVLVVFYILGEIFKLMLIHFEKQNEKKTLDEGEVIEKTPEESKQ